MMDWILNPSNVALIGWILALGTPLAAGCFLLAAPNRRQGRLRSGFFWIGAGSGPLLAALWFLFNGIVGLFGLDSFPGLLIHLLLFAAIGILIGALLRWSLKRKLSDAAGTNPRENAGASENGTKKRAANRAGKA